MSSAKQMVGSVIDGWKITGTLGQGAMGVVYEATQGPRRAAFKVADPSALGRDNLQRFRREAGILESIDHPHVVRCYHAGEADRFVYLALEYLDGGSLEDVFEVRGKLTVPQAVGVTRRLLLALQAAHDRKVLHRDIKPGNVLFDGKGRPKLADFGLARAKGQAKITVAGSVLGTVDYMSPEQFEFIGDLDHRADLYSLGGLLFHMLTGHPPYQGRSSLSVLQQHRDAPIPKPSYEVPDALPLDGVIDALMAKSRDDRPKSALAAYDMLTELPEEPLFPGGSLDPDPARGGTGGPSRALDALALLGVLLAGGAAAAVHLPQVQAQLPPDLLGPLQQAWLPAAGVAGVLALTRIVARLR